MWRIAWHNLYRDKVRFITAVVGLVFAVVLMAVQASIFLGAVKSSSLLASEMAGDLWIVPYRSSNADFSVAMPDRRRYQALGVPGVKRTGRMVGGFSVWRFPSGRQEPVIVVGTDVDYDWLPIDRNLMRTRTNEGRGVVLDERERYRFAENETPLAVGDRGELGGHRVLVAGFARKMASFTITPYVFTSYEGALDFAKVDAGETIFVMVK